MSQHSKHAHDRHGARQKERFNPERAAKLDDPARFEYLPAQDIERLLDVPAGGTLVDFGTGNGTYAVELARLRPDIRVVALDELPEMLDRLCAKPALAALTNIKPMLASEIGDFKEKIDRVLALNVLHELGDEALRDIGSLLNRDGAALFIDWNAGVERPAGPPADHLYTPLEARTRLERIGFTIEGEHSFPYHYGFNSRWGLRW